MKTFRRRVRSASRRVGGSNCDLKSNLSSFLQFSLPLFMRALSCIQNRWRHFQTKKNSFLFVLSLPSLFAFIIRLEITYAKFCLNINQLSRKFFFSCNSRFSRLEIVADFYFVYFFLLRCSNRIENIFQTIH